MKAADIANAGERRYAEHLDAIKMPWVHQPEAFRFAGTRYTPDFFLPIQNIYVEVIGTRQRWHQLKGKISRFREHYPGVVLQVLSCDGRPYPPFKRSRGPHLDRGEILSAIEDYVRAAGSAKALAEEWGVSQPYLSDVRAGKRDPGPSILAKMGLSAATVYTKSASA